LAPLIISFQIKSCTKLCWLGDDRNGQLEEIASSFEITDKRTFSVAERMFISSLVDVIWLIFDALIFINCNKDFKHLSFLFN